MAAESQPDREVALGRVRGVLARLIRDGTATARSDGSVHRLFPVAVGPAEGAAIRSWVIREQAGRTIEVGLGYGISALFACEGLFTVVGRAHGMSSSTRISTPGSLARGCNTWTRPTSHRRR